MKKFLSLLLTLCMIVSAGIVCTASADDTDLTTVSILSYDYSGKGFFYDRETQLVWQEATRMFEEAGITFDLEIVADSSQYKTTIQTRLASAHDLPDMFYGGYTDVTDLLDMADMGMILEIGDILETTKGAGYSFFFGGVGDQARKLISDTDGNFYWLPRIQINQLNGTNAGTSMCISIRYDWLNKLGLEVPNSLDSFEGALKAFQENDMNGNGVVDEVMVLDTSSFGVGMNLWFGIPTCDKTGIGINLTEKTVESAWYSPYIKEYFTYVRKLVEEGLISADFIGTDTSSNNLLTNNQVAAEEYYSCAVYDEAAIVAGGCEDAYLIGIYPFSAVEGATAFYSEETPYLVYLRHCVSSVAEDKKEAIAKIYDVIYGEEYTNLMLWGIEGKQYEVKEDGTKRTLINGISTTDLHEQGLLTVDNLYRPVLPNFYYNERLASIEARTALGWGDKQNYDLVTADYQPRTPNDNSGYYALGTPEENEILALYSTDLATTSREIAANLSLGVYSVDDMDKYIEELRATGLDEVLAVRQAQYARGQGYQSYDAMGDRFDN